MKITPEIAEQINELYCEIGIKSQVAKIIGCSASTVSKYIQPDYIPKSERIETISFNKEPTDIKQFLETIVKLGGGAKGFCKACKMTEEEKSDLIELQKEIYI
jgi:predicted transcriptional regulator